MAATDTHVRNDNAPLLHARLHALYGRQPQFEVWFAHLQQRLDQLASARPDELRTLDARRLDEHMPDHKVLGYCAYADRLAGGLAGVLQRLPHLSELGVRYLHLLPFTEARIGDNDGGFAVRDYERVDPRLGTDEDLVELTRALRHADIRLCADLVLNHTADDHPWAHAARAGDARYRRYYRLAHTRSEVEVWEQSLPQVFPDTAPGNFTRVDELDAWAWTTFYPYQWDLDWSNPEVFEEIVCALARLANRGIEVFRLDSTAFLWKRQGTRCMNEPETHWIVQALRAALDRVAPGVLLKAEAIVPIRELPPYFGLAQDQPSTRECQLAYNSSMMAAAWAALATESARIPAAVLASMPSLPVGCAWVNYVRCHDDIGWQVLAEEAASAGTDLDHVAAFFAGHNGSYARGEAFQTGSAGTAHGTNGMTAALCGLSAARASADPDAQGHALDRFLLLYGLAFALPGVPMVYMGDEIALDNDIHFRDDPELGHEGRWLHRPRMPWSIGGSPMLADALAARVRLDLGALLRLRGEIAALAPAVACRLIPSEDSALLQFARGDRFRAAFNFSSRDVVLDLGGEAWHSLRRGQVASTRLGPWGFDWCLRGGDT
jgi:amylosucrase